MADAAEQELGYTEGVPGGHHTPDEWVNDWDLLSPRFQAEATVYIQLFAVFVVAVLILRRARRPKPSLPAAASADTPPVVDDGVEQET